MASERWVEVAVRVAPPDVEAVTSLLDALTDAGVVVEPAIRVSDVGDFEYELLDVPGTVRACFPTPLRAADRRALRRRLTALPLSAPLPRLRFATVEDRDWSEEWKRFFDVQHVGERLVIRPSWRRYEPAHRELVIDLDPGQAFGTGQHQTTRLALRALERRVSPQCDVIDVGTGSGILAIAAALLGARSVLALEPDADAATVARENVERNRGAGTVAVEEGSLGPDAAARSADIIAVNISSKVLVTLMPRVARMLRPGGALIGSGFIDTNQGDVEAAVAACGLRTQRIDAEDEWRCITAVAPEQ